MWHILKMMIYGKKISTLSNAQVYRYCIYCIYLCIHMEILVANRNTSIVSRGRCVMLELKIYCRCSKWTIIIRFILYVIPNTRIIITSAVAQLFLIHWLRKCSCAAIASAVCAESLKLIPHESPLVYNSI